MVPSAGPTESAIPVAELIAEASASTLPASTARIELQPQAVVPSRPELEEDPNAEILRQFRREQAASRPVAKATPKSDAAKSESFERFGPMAPVLNPIIRLVGSFPLAILTSVTVTAIVIAVWNLIAVAVGMPLEIFYVIVPVAAGIGLCIITSHYGRMMGLLSLVMGTMAIIAGRMTQVHLFVFPEWNRIVTAADIPSDREAFYLTMNQIGGKRGLVAARQDLSMQDIELPTMAICTLIQNKQLDPVLGIELYFAARPQLEQSSDPLTETANLTFQKPEQTQAWPNVIALLKEWDTPDKRLAAVEGVYLRYLFFQEQTRYKTLMDDYPKAMTAAFFMCPGGCLFMYLRLTYCIVGLIGAYKTCSESFMD